MNIAVASVTACLFFLVPTSPAEASRTWTTFDGKVVQASAVDFDFETKTVTLENGENSRVTYKTKDLDFTSKRMLFFSRAFWQSQAPGNLGMWKREKMIYYAICVLLPMVLLIVGMWLAGLFIAKSINPFNAVGAFLGSWIAGAILMTCYYVFGAKSGITGNGLLWFGALIAAAVVALFVSSVYRTGFLRGFLIFICHLLFAGLVGYILVFETDSFFPNQTSEFWEKWVFTPTGLIDGPRQGY